MDDLKQYIAPFLICILIWLGFQFYMQQKYPPSPPASAPSAEQATPTAERSAPGSEQTAPAVGTASPSAAAAPAAITAAPAAQSWRLLIPQSSPAEVALGERRSPRLQTADLIGSSEEKAKLAYKAQINIDSSSAAVRSVLLSEYKLNIRDKQYGYPLLSPALTAANQEKLSFMLGRMKLANRPEEFDLSTACWQESQPKTTDQNHLQSVQFTASVVDSDDRPVLEIIKTYRYQPDNYELEFSLRFVNKASTSVQIDSLELLGPLGLLREDPRGDRRGAITAYQTPKNQLEFVDVQLTKIESDPGNGIMEKTAPSVLWYGVANKYFAAAVQPVTPDNVKTPDFLLDNRIVAKALRIAPHQEESIYTQTTLAIESILTMDHPLAPGQAGLCTFKAYLGPIDNDIFDQPQFAQLDYQRLRYQPSCAICSFQWLTAFLFKLLKGVHAVVPNYGIAIIILVLLVRLILHPITKKSQVNMQKMQKLGPRAEEIRQKYAGNKEEINKRTMALYKEQGMAGNMLLGCLPMVLQMPIWIALYTAVDSNIALRHQGLFPAAWLWLTDLSAPDRLIPFSLFGITQPFNIPLLGGVDAFNLLPILLCIAMFLQSKYTTSATVTAATNPQAASQQKMMLYMLPAMMLVFFYSAPSGLNLYIMASTFGGLIEQYFIRKHLRREEALAAQSTVAPTSKIISRLGPKKKKPKPPFKHL